MYCKKAAVTDLCSQSNAREGAIIRVYVSNKNQWKLLYSNKKKIGRIVHGSGINQDKIYLPANKSNSKNLLLMQNTSKRCFKLDSC